MQQALGKVGPATVEPVPTLSIGIGIGHLLESMGQLRRLGRDAEHLAKGRRNALAIVVDKRSGGTTPLCESWTEDPATRLQRAVALLDGALSMSKVHEIQRELSRLPAGGVLLPGEQAQWSELLQREVERILARTGDGSGLSAGEVDLVWHAGASYDVRRRDVDAWCSRMLIARELSAAIASTRDRERSRGAEVTAEAV
jgi:CRISPR-associated protein Cmr2